MRSNAPIASRSKSAVQRGTREGGAPARWILLLPSIPPADASSRVKVWRQLQKLGAVALKNAVYVLPNREECVEAFQWIARELAELGGQSSLCEGQFFDGETDAEIERRFVEARNADFGELAKEVRALLTTLKAKRLSTEKIETLAGRVQGLQRRFDEIVAIDFCRASGRDSVEGLLVAINRRLGEIRGDVRVEPLTRVAPPVHATWVTRTGVHIDRIACAWLIGRFIDPKGSLKFVPPKGYVPETGELRFDMYDAEFTHVGDRCSFEVLVVRMGLDRDAALCAIGEIVHDIDLRDEKYGRAETVGVESAVTGICAGTRDDLARIGAATPLLDGLYTFFSRKRSTK